jgi:hypothetical protein
MTVIREWWTVENPLAEETIRGREYRISSGNRRINDEISAELDSL